MTPPADNTGSAITAHSAPTDCCSTISKPASKHEQSQVPLQWRIGHRYAYGAGSVRLPGINGPYPACPTAAKLSEATPACKPCHALVNPTTSKRPVYILAIRKAAS